MDRFIVIDTIDWDDVDLVLEDMGINDVCDAEFEHIFELAALRYTRAVDKTSLKHECIYTSIRDVLHIE